MSRLPIALWILVCVSLSHAHLDAFEIGTAQIRVEPYVKGGTLAWDELSGTGGHKSLVALGFNSLATFGRLGAGFNFEKWWLAERLDDDKASFRTLGTD